MKYWFTPLSVFPAIGIIANSFKNNLNIERQVPIAYMEYHPIAPLLNEEGYEIWIIRMMVFLQAIGYDTLQSVVIGYTPSKRPPKSTSKK